MGYNAARIQKSISQAQEVCTPREIAIDATQNNAADQEFIKRTLDGDESAFASLREKYHHKIYGLCLRLTDNEADAEDVEQEAFLHAFSGLKKFGGRSSFYTWLYRITINCFLMRERKKTVPAVPIDEVAEYSAGDHDTVIQPRDDGGGGFNLMRPAEIGRPDKVLESLPVRYLLAKAMEGVPKCYRTTIILHDFEGLEFEEIAKIRGQRINTIKSQRYRGLARLFAEIARLCEIPISSSASLADLRKKLKPVFTF